MGDVHGLMKMSFDAVMLNKTPDMAAVIAAGANTPNQLPLDRFLRYAARPSDVTLQPLLDWFDHQERIGFQCWSHPGAGDPTGFGGCEQNTDDHDQIYLAAVTEIAWAALNCKLCGRVLPSIHAVKLLAATERWIARYHAMSLACMMPNGWVVIPGARSNGAAFANPTGGNASTRDALTGILTGRLSKSPFKNLDRYTISAELALRLVTAGRLKDAIAGKMDWPPLANRMIVARYDRGHIAVMATDYGIEPLAWVRADWTTGERTCAVVGPGGSGKFERLRQEAMSAKILSLVKPGWTAVSVMGATDAERAVVLGAPVVPPPPVVVSPPPPPIQEDRRPWWRRLLGI